MRGFSCLTAGLILLTLTATPAKSDLIEHSEFSYRNWVGGGYTVDGTNRFSHCAVQATYLSGDVLFFSINANATITIAIENRKWSLTNGQKIDVKVQIDRRAPFYGTAEAINSTFAVLRLDDFNRALRAIQKGYVMTIQSNDWRGEYNLTGTFRALERAKTCVRKYYDYPRVSAPQPAPDLDTKPIARASEAPAVDVAYLYQLATVMITEAQVRDFRYLTTEEKASFGMGDAVFWTSDSLGIVGGVSATRVGPDADLRELGASDFRTIARECTGYIVTGARAVEHEGFPGRELRAVCSAGEAGFEMYLTTTLVGEILIDILLYFPGEVASPAPQHQRLSEDIRVRAASFVMQTPN